MPTPSNVLNISSSGIVSFNSPAAFSSSTLTQHDVLVGGASNAISSVGPGTAGQVILSGGAGADPSYVTPTAGPGVTIVSNASTLQYSVSEGIVLVQTLIATNSASLVFNTGTNLENYLLMGSNISNSAGTSLLLLQTSPDGGSTWKTSLYTSGIFNMTPGSGTAFSATSVTTGFPLTNTTNTGFSSFSYYITGAQVTDGIPCFGSSTLNPAAASLPICYFTTGLTNGALANAFRLIMVSGNILTGTFSLYSVLPSVP
jgi:hypothetical protein